MFSNPVLERLQQELLLLPSAKSVSTPTELASVRCPLCNDSIHKNSSHFYVGIKEINGKQTLVYDCKLCSASGILTPSLLHRLGINDLMVDEYIKSTINKGNVKTFSQEDDTSSLVYKYPQPTNKEKRKVDYISNRLGIDFSDFNNIKKYRVVLNLSKFLKMNNITEPRVSEQLIPLLDDEGCGFVSADKTSISFRNLMFNDDDGSGLDRFNIIHLYQNIKRPYFYTPPMAIDLLTTVPEISVSESVFNIINVQNYFYGQDNPNVVLGSSSRKGCARTINNLINMTGFVGGKLNIFCDNDKTFDIGYFEKILDPYQSTFNITLYLNEEGKDFGELPKNGETYNYRTIKI